MNYDQDIIYEEGQNQDEILFFEQGNYDLGYEINGKLKYKLRFRHRIGIGAFYVTFGTKTKYNCKANGDCKGYSITKREWLASLNKFPQIEKSFKLKLLQDFHQKERRIMEIHKMRDIIRYCGGLELKFQLKKNKEN